jgi:hypothetical protein
MGSSASCRRGSSSGIESAPLDVSGGKLFARARVVDDVATALSSDQLVAAEHLDGLAEELAGGALDLGERSDGGVAER